MDITLQVDQKQNFTLAPKDANGEARELTNLSWSVLSGDATVTPAADGLSADVIPSDTPGSSVIEVSGTNSEGTVLTDSINLTSVAVPVTPAVDLGLTAGEVSPK